MTLLEVENLWAGYGELDILRGVSLSVERGEIVVIIGPNGAGKSTLMKALSGLLTPSSGRMAFSGENLAGLKPHEIVARGLSYVPQSENVFPSLTVEENLDMGAYIRKGDVSARKCAVYGLLPELMMRRRARVRTLSGGQCQMVAIGRALMLEPKLLMLDEPTASLSPILAKAIFDKVVAINRAGTAVLMVEQRAGQALERAHRAYVLSMGVNRFEGTGQELLNNREVAELFLGG